jgi:hypothetical protein
MAVGNTGGPDAGELDAVGNWTNGADVDGLTQKKRVSVSDKIRAADINELRGRLEVLINHTHQFDYSTGGGGGTTTCG